MLTSNITRGCNVIYIYIDSCRIHTDAINKQTQKDFFNKIFTSHFICKGFERVVWGFTVRGSWRLNRNCNILTSNLMAVNIVSFLFSWCWSPLCWVLAFFTASYQHLLWTPTHQGPKPLRPGVALPTTSRLSPSPTLLQLNWLLTSVLTALYNSSTPTRLLKSNV